MKNIYSNIYKPNLHNLIKAKKNIENNNIIAIPTETVYGLAGNAFSNKAVNKIFNLKKRPTINPLIIHFGNLKDVKNEVITNKNFIKLAKIFCPGPITFILKKKTSSKICDKATAGKKTVAIRIPKNRISKKLLNILRVPLAAPSANMSSKLSPTSAEDVVDEFKDKIKFVLDGGNCQIGLESTIIDLTNNPKILRQGIITKEQIEKILKKKVKTKTMNNLKKIKAPGQFKLHYSPGIPVKLNIKFPKKNQAFIGFGKKFKPGKNRFNLSKNGNLKEAANNLYKTLRKIKNSNFASIAVSKIPDIGIGNAINERLKKASNR